MATLHEDGFYWAHARFTVHGTEQNTNALFIASYLRGKGWTDNAIAGILGNMQSESGINPGAYYGYSDFSAVSFGIVQWDPTSKYQNWHDDRYPGIIYEHLGCQLERILYELEEGIQYYKTDKFPLTFREFSTSNETPGYLAKAFVRNYERPASILYGTAEEQEATYSQRANQANYWYEYITGNPAPDVPDTPGGETPTPTKGKHLSKLLLYAVGSDIV